MVPTLLASPTISHCAAEALMTGEKLDKGKGFFPVNRDVQVKHNVIVPGQTVELHGAKKAHDTVCGQDEWIQNIDLEGFGNEVRELGRRLKMEEGVADMEHLKKMMRWCRLCAVIGCGTMWMPINPMTVLALGLWMFSSFLPGMHHISHGAYNHIDKSGYFCKRNFAVASLWRRVVDWLDWFEGKAWHVSHNKHHDHFCEDIDPELVEVQAAKWGGTPTRLLMLPLAMTLWRPVYFASNQYKELKVAQCRSKGVALPDGCDPHSSAYIHHALTGGEGLYAVTEFLSKVIGPYILFRFCLLPLPLALLNSTFYWRAVAHLVLGDIVYSIWAALVIAPTHCGSDLYRYEQHVKPNSPSFFLRQCISTVNIGGFGGDIGDFLLGWATLHVEHHVWPSLTLLSYQKAAPELQKICAKYGVPYTKESMLQRVWKALAVILGFSKMRRFPSRLTRKIDNALGHSC